MSKCRECPRESIVDVPFKDGPVPLCLEHVKSMFACEHLPEGYCRECGSTEVVRDRLCQDCIDLQSEVDRAIGHHLFRPDRDIDDRAN